MGTGSGLGLARGVVEHGGGLARGVVEHGGGLARGVVEHGGGLARGVVEHVDGLARGVAELAGWSRDAPLLASAVLRNSQGTISICAQDTIVTAKKSFREKKGNITHSILHMAEKASALHSQTLRWFVIVLHLHSCMKGKKVLEGHATINHNKM
jgi:hypothetical protein